VTKSLLPTVAILPSTLTISRSTGFELLGNASIPSCSKFVKLAYNWTIQDETTLSYLPIKSNSLNPTIFKLRPNALKSYKSYVVKLTVYASSTSQNYAEAVVSVYPPPFYASIAGGQEQFAVSGELVAVTATISDDVYTLSYSWFCVDISASNFGSSCSGIVFSNSQSNLIQFQNSSSRYNISVKITNGYSTASAYSIFNIVENRVPIVTIAPLFYKYNADTKIVLVGYINASMSCNATWSYTVAFTTNQLALTS